MYVNLLENNEICSSKTTDILNITNIKNLHDKGCFGENIVIAIIDTGCCNHNLLSQKIIGGKNFTNEGSQDNFNDLNGHGTHVAGSIAADTNNYFSSVAPKSKLLILKALNKEGSGSLEGIINAIYYAIEQKVDIINMSLGCSTSDEALYNAVKKAIDNNILVVCASGNSGDNNEYTYESDYPGAYEEVIEVGAIDSNSNVSKFSNNNKFVDVVAPGENIMSTSLNNGFKTLSGTSMATPIVSGTLALLIEWSNKEFKRRLSESELYGLLIKNTKNLDFDRTLQGHGAIFINVDK